MFFQYKIFQVVVCCLVLTLFSFCLHVLPNTNTMINYVDEHHPKQNNEMISDGFLPWSVDFHQKLFDFKKRPLTSFLIEILSSVLNIKISYAFVIINFTLTFFCALIVYYLSQQFFNSHVIPLISSAYFLLSFSVLFAYFIPIATYDEPIQFLFLILTLIALKKRKYILYIIFLTFALIARESSLIIIPGIVLFLSELDIFQPFKDKKILIRTIVINSIPIIIYGIYIILFYYFISEASERPSLYERFSLYEKNFRNISNTIRTFISFASINLFPVFLIVFSWKFFKNNAVFFNWIKAFVLTTFINTSVVFISVFAEEARVFSLPLIFMFPFFGQMLLFILTSLKTQLTLLSNIKIIFLSTIVTFFFWIGIKKIYNMTDLNLHNNLYEEYHAICIFLILLAIFRKYFSYKYEIGKNY